MTTREARGLAAVDTEEESIAGYLQRNPEFFERHQAVLARLKLPHSRGGSTISLVERQIEVLREPELRRLRHVEHRDFSGRPIGSGRRRHRASAAGGRPDQPRVARVQ